jgi:hypothetical protein
MAMPEPLWLPDSYWEAKREEAREAYYLAHTRCPRCRGLLLAIKCLGYGTNDWANAQDPARASCGDRACRWRGIVHDLKPL